MSRHRRLAVVLGVGAQMALGAHAAWPISLVGSFKGLVDANNPIPGGYFGGVVGQGFKSNCTIGFDTPSHAFTLTCTYKEQLSPPFGCYANSGNVTSKALIGGTLGNPGVSVGAEDPVILQFPDDITNFRATFNGPSSGSNVPLPSGIGCVALAQGGRLCAEQGRQLVLIDLAGLADGGYGFGISFTTPTPNPVSFKAIFAAKVMIGSTARYVPMFPCKTDFADIGSLTIPAVNDQTPQPLQVNFAELVDGCQELHIDLGLRLPAPLLGRHTLAAVAVLLALGGAHVLNQKRKRRALGGLGQA